MQVTSKKLALTGSLFLSVTGIFDVVFSYFHPRVHAYALNIQESEAWHGVICALVSPWFLLRTWTVASRPKGNKGKARMAKQPTSTRLFRYRMPQSRFWTAEKRAAPEWLLCQTAYLGAFAVSSHCRGITKTGGDCWEHIQNWHSNLTSKYATSKL